MKSEVLKIHCILIYPWEMKTRRSLCYVKQKQRALTEIDSYKVIAHPNTEKRGVILFLRHIANWKVGSVPHLMYIPF